MDVCASSVTVCILKPPASSSAERLRTAHEPQKNDEFQKLGKAMQAEAAKLNEIALKKDEAGLKAQVMETGKSCKACHDTYRSPDYEKENEE